MANPQAYGYGPFPGMFPYQGMHGMAGVEFGGYGAAAAAAAHHQSPPVSSAFAHSW